MGFKFASFGAATVPLSKIVIDGMLDMGNYPLVGQRIMAPYRPYTWGTEPFPYDDRSPTTLMTGISKNFYNEEVLVLTWTCDTPKACYVRAIIPTGSAGCSNVDGARIVINGETVYTTGSWPAGTTKTTDAIAIAPGEVFELYASNTGGTYGSCIKNCSLVNTGHQAPLNLNLQGRFLALEQDFGNLTATLTFGDEENVPFTEYPNRFPYAPDKITFNRHKLEDRPVIKVYKATIDWLEETRGWATETLDWGDIPPGDPIPFKRYISGEDTWTTLFTFDVPTGDTYKWRFTFITSNANTGAKANFKITANEKEIFYVSDVSWGTWTYDVIIPAGSTVTIQISKNSGVYYVMSGSNVQNLGFVCGPKTFDLTGKWLALGIDMHGLDAMIEIQGELVPYTDYIKYFPVKPTKLIIPGGWSYNQERPEIRVYKND